MQKQFNKFIYANFFEIHSPFLLIIKGIGHLMLFILAVIVGLYLLGLFIAVNNDSDIEDNDDYDPNNLTDDDIL